MKQVKWMAFALGVGFAQFVAATPPNLPLWVHLATTDFIFVVAGFVLLMDGGK